MVTLQSGLDRVTAFASDAIEGLSGNPAATAIGGAVIGGALVGTTALAVGAIKKRRRTTAAKKRRTVRKSAKRTTKKRRTYKYARTAGKRKDTSTRRIRMTKNGQPYVILASGKARFIKKSSARNSRKRKGGRY